MNVTTSPVIVKVVNCVLVKTMESVNVENASASLAGLVLLAIVGPLMKLASLPVAAKSALERAIVNVALASVLKAKRDGILVASVKNAL